MDRDSVSLLKAMRKPIVVAHRVNSKGRAQAMARHGIGFVEIDVRERQGRLIVEHGFEVSSLRRCKVIRSLAKLMYKLSTVGDPLWKPLELEKYMELFAKKFYFWIDIKSRGIEEKILEILHRYGVSMPLIVSSGYHDVLKKIKEIDPDIAVFLGNISFYPMDSCIARAAHADGMSIEFHYIDRELVDRLHREGLMVAVWTVNDVEEAIKLRELGVDIIITDYPLDIIEALSSVQH